MRDCNRIAVIGAGTTGHAIAQVFATAGIPTRVTDGRLRFKPGGGFYSENCGCSAHDRILQRDERIASTVEVFRHGTALTLVQGEGSRGH